MKKKKCTPKKIKNQTSKTKQKKPANKQNQNNH